MKNLMRLGNRTRSLAPFTVYPLFLLIFLVCSGYAQVTPPDTTATTSQPVQAVKKPVQTPFIHDLQGVTLGMTPSEVKKVLGRPATSDDTSMFYQHNGEDIQLTLDADHKVTMIATMYTGKDSDTAPDFTKVFGPDVQMEPADKGRVYKLVRYPDVGYWVAYSRTELKDGTMTTVTLQKMRDR